MSQTDLHPAPQSRPTPPTPPHPPESTSTASVPKEGEEQANKGDTQRRGPDKVRIYDLAREMGRDNKEILDACDRLSIPYKSHSSTISPEQADQIRNGLGDAPASSGSSGATGATPRPPRLSRPQPKPQSAKASSKAAEERAQILNVRPPTAPERPQISRPTPPETATGSRSLSGLATPPRKPEAPTTARKPEPAPSPAEETSKEAAPSLVRPPKRPQETQGDSPSTPAADASGLAEKDTSPAAQQSSTTAPALETEAQEDKGQQEKELQRPSLPPRPQRSEEAKATTELRPKPAASTPASETRKPTGSKPSTPKRQEPSPPELLAKPVPPKPPERPTRSERSERSERPAQPKETAPKVKLVSSPKAATKLERESERGGRPSRPERSEPPTKPTRAPQLVGAPVRPKSQVRVDPQSQEQHLPGDLVAKEEKTSQKPKLQRRPSKPELVSPPARHPAQEEESPAAVLADAPVRPLVRLKRKEEEEEDEDLNLLKKPTRSQTKKKRSRRKTGDGEGDGSELDVLASVSAAKQAELNALKPLPRPGAKPKSAAPPPAKSRPQSSPSPKPRRSSPQHAPATGAETEDAPKLVVLESNLTVQDLADRMNLSETEIIRLLFMKGFMVNINQVLDIPTMELVAKELEYDVEFKTEESQAKKTEMLDLEDIDHLVLRPPVVTIMGHVDHGKTTLLDAIRDTKVVEGEAGGITQRIGAYHVDVELEGEMRRVVFLDTPGHEAFTSMRARGAKVTDIAVLVVAADDGVQPQTLEAISHAKAAEVPIVVAVNKIDKPDSQPDRIKQQLSEHGLVPEEWGGDTPMVEVSALARMNLDGLLEMLLLVADIGELQANPNRPARGTVVEANLDKARGPLATILIQNGTLRVGDPVVAGSIFGRVKAMIDDRGQRLEEAGPSSAVQLLGLGDVPLAGDEFAAYANEREARRIAEVRAEAQRQDRLQQQMLSRRVSLGKVSADAQEGKLKELNLIIKTDVQGSAEAILASLQQINQEEVQVRVLLSAPGEIVETDVDLAAASDAIIIGFTTNVSSHVRQLADRYGVDIREYDIIYNLLEDITGAMEGLLEPEEVEEPLGEAEVRMVIPIGKGAIAGCSVRSGKVLRNALIRVHRQGNVIFSGRLDSLKRFKDDVREVASGFECGIGVDKFQDWTEGDSIEVYQMVTKRRTLITAEAGRR